MIIIEKTMYFYCISSQKPDGIYSIAITSFPFVKSAFTLRVLCGLWYIRNQREMYIIIISCNRLCVCWDCKILFRQYALENLPTRSLQNENSLSTGSASFSIVPQTFLCTTAFNRSAKHSTS